LRYALAVFAISLAIAVVVAVLLSTSALRLGIGVLLIDVVLLATLFPLYRRGLLSRQVLGLAATAPARSVKLVLFALFVYGGFAAFWIRVVSAPPPAAPLREGTLALAVTGFALALCAPVVEEIFFRGLLYGALRNRLPVVPAVLIGGLLFGAVHATTYPLSTLPVKALFGVIACLLYERTGSLLPAIALHCFVDALSFEELVSHTGGIVFICFAALGGVLLIRAGIARRAGGHARPAIATSVNRISATRLPDQVMLKE
jgi:membrane protease YdiL (CAAX protease family)